MTAISSYPHYRINVEDRSIFVPVAADQLPIHRPVYAMNTQRGPIGVPVWCDTIQEARRIFGAETFNQLNKDYFSPTSYYLNETFKTNGAFIVRLAEAAADTAMLILEVSVKDVQVQQYEKNAFGVQTRDGNGDLIPDTVAGLQAGVELNWLTRSALRVDGNNDPVEDYDNLLPYNSTDGDGDAVTIYPIMTFKATSSGAWGNDSGFKLSWDKKANDVDAVERAGALYFTLAPIQKEYNASTVDPVRDKYGDTAVSFVLKPDVIDPAYVQAVSFKEVAETRYSEGATLPYEVNVMASHIEAVGDLVRAKEVGRAAEITDGWLANIISLQDLAGLPYDHAVFGDEVGRVSLEEDNVHYLATGNDGDTSDTMLESLVRNFYELDINPDIVDRARYPFTHLFDIGWSIDTKYALIDFMTIRDDIKVVAATQTVTDINGVVTGNTTAQDESVGSALRGAALVNRESIIKGTGAFRCMIFQQAGIPHGTYGKWLPTTLWYAIKLAEYHNRDFMADEPAGLPNSDIDIFKEMNWIPAAESTRERGWNTGLNYCQYYTMTRLHFPALRSVYRYDTSVLAIDDFTNAMVYTKHEIRQSWAQFAGVTRPAGILQDQIEKDLSARLQRLYNNRYQFTIDVYQTDEEMKLGYVHHVRVTVTSPGQNRVWDVDVVCKRENFEG